MLGSSEMGKLSNISGKSAIKVFCKIGYFIDRQEGSHIILVNNKSGYPILSIPDHKELALFQQWKTRKPDVLSLLLRASLRSSF